MRSSSTGPLSRAALGAALVAVLLASMAAAAQAAVTSRDIGSASGPLTSVAIGSDLSCQVGHSGDSVFEFFPSSTSPGDCGTIVATGGAVYAPDFANHGPSGGATAAANKVNNGTYTPFSQVSQSSVTGSGTNASPRQVTTTVDAGATGLRIVETDSYVDGNEFYRTSLAFSNSTASAITATVYHAADCYLQGSDKGYGFVDGSSGGAYCAANANNSPAGRVEGFAPITSGSNYIEAGYATVWYDVVAAGTQFPNTCDCATFEDNGAGLSWPISVPANGSLSVSLVTQSSPTGTIVNPQAPIVATDPASDITSSAATLRGSVNPNNDATTYHFEWGTDTSYGHSTPSGAAGSDNSSHAESAPLTGLQPNTTYHYRIVATNTGGTSHGDDVTFKTAALPGQPPVAVTHAATDVTSTSATLHGAVNPKGIATTYHFQYGVDTSYGGTTTSAPAGSDSASHPEAAAVSNLKPDTLYHFRIVAHNSKGTTHGDDMTFRTPAPAGPPPPEAKKNVNASASGNVDVKCPGKPKRHLSGKESKVPLGCLFDATHGTVHLVWDDGCKSNGYDTGSFGGKPFVPTETDDKQHVVCGNGLVLDLDVRDPGPFGCDDPERQSNKIVPFVASDTKRRVHSHHHHSGATVRGTDYEVFERCDGTLTVVRKGAVTVRDFRLHRSVLVTAGHSYLARIPGGHVDDPDTAR